MFLSYEQQWVACKGNETRRVHVSIASDTLWFIDSWKSEKLNSFLIFTFISLYRLLKNYQGDQICKQKENLHTLCVEAAERRRRRHDVTTFNHIDESHGFS